MTGPYPPMPDGCLAYLGSGYHCLYEAGHDGNCVFQEPELDYETWREERDEAESGSYLNRSHAL